MYCFEKTKEDTASKVGQSGRAPCKSKPKDPEGEEEIVPGEQVREL